MLSDAHEWNVSRKKTHFQRPVKFLKCPSVHLVFRCLAEGAIPVDYVTQKRTPKYSADYYRQVSEANRVL